MLLLLTVQIFSACNPMLSTTLTVHVYIVTITDGSIYLAVKCFSPLHRSSHFLHSVWLSFICNENNLLVNRANFDS